MRAFGEELKEKLLNYIEEYIKENGVAPSLREAGAALDVNYATIQRYLKKLKDEGRISQDGKKISSKELDKVDENILCPIVGSIPCGTPEEEAENIEKYIKIPKYIYGEGKYYLLRADGNSMINRGINSGDYLLIRQQSEAKSGQVIVALTNHNGSTLKTYIPDPENGRVILHAENDEIEDQIYSGDDMVEIQGVCVAVWKNML